MKPCTRWFGLWLGMMLVFGTLWPQAAFADASPSSGQELVVDLNRASAAEFAALPGVGPKRAAEFVRARRIRPYKRVSDIMRIRGVGRKTYLRLRRYLRVGPPPQP